MVTQEIIATIVEKDLNATLVESVTIAKGYVGDVYAVTVARDEQHLQFCLKFTETEDEPDYDDLPVDDRIYAARPSNFQAVYELLQEANLPIPTCLSTGTIVQSETQLAYQVMSLLDGVDVRNTLAFGNPPAAEQLHKLTGTLFGKLHTYTRAYDGWVAQFKPYSLSWDDAYFQSLRSQLTIACQHSSVIQGIRAEIDTFIDNHATTWTTPNEFVFSHIDGLQALAIYADDQWQITGLVDIEDHCFADQRFVLAGHDLILRVGGRELPSAFWQAYQAVKPVPDDYARIRPLFQLYYLLAWLPGFYRAAQTDPTEMHTVIETHEQLIIRDICRIEL